MPFCLTAAFNGDGRNSDRQAAAVIVPTIQPIVMPVNERRNPPKLLINIIIISRRKSFFILK